MVDVQDCLEAFRRAEIDPYRLFQNYRETAQYDLNPDRVMENFILFVERLYVEGLISEEFLNEVKA